MSPPPRPAPESPSALFWAFTQLALQGFGGVVTVAQRELVERRRWLSNAEFLEDMAVAQVLPGPNICNLALMLGDRHHGWRGALAALLGLFTVPLLLMLLAVMAYGQVAAHPLVVGALRGMGAVVAGLIGGTALKLWWDLRGHPMGTALAWAASGLTLLAVVVLNWPLTAVIFGLGSASVLLTAWRLHRGPTRQRADLGDGE